MDKESFVRKIYKYQKKMDLSNDIQKNDLYIKKIKYYKLMLDNQSGKGLFDSLKITNNIFKKKTPENKSIEEKKKREENKSI
jgi:hypothetical protein